MSKPMYASVILCTHNPRLDYLQRCLDALRTQTLPHDRWEFIIVDNRSDEMVADKADISWHPAARVVREDTLGLTPARLRGIHEATGNLLVFVDDDNALDAEFLATAVGVAEKMPFLGSWSGQCRPEFSKPPAEWTRRYWGNLVIREFTENVWSNLPRLAETMPCGAGLCVRREVAQHYLNLNETGMRTFQLDRAGSSLVSGGDNDLAAVACKLGLGVGLIASLKLTHLIPPERLKLDYIVRLAEGIHYSGMVLDHYYGCAAQRPSLGRKILFWLRLAFQDPRHAKVALAVERGKSRGRKAIADLEKNAKNDRDR